jgi:hypothetical protein
MSDGDRDEKNDGCSCRRDATHGTVAIIVLLLAAFGFFGTGHHGSGVTCVIAAFLTAGSIYW